MTNNIIKLVSKSGRRYIFDAIGNNIYEVESDRDFRSIKLQDLGYSHDTRTDALSSESISDDVLKNAKTLIIELTEDCNFRCKYCAFDESHPQERNHSEKTLPIDAAKKEMESFYGRTNGREAYVVFYGGEPLLEYEKIIDLVNHGNLISNGIFKYSLTTNGVLLTKDKIEFLAKNNFLITVSIDGPQDIHDKHRISKNGKGTHKTIESNLKKILKSHPHFFAEQIEINSTISNATETGEINEYFTSSEIFKGKEIRFSPVMQNALEINSKISNSISLDLVNQSLKSKKPVFLKPIESSFLGDVVKKITCRKLDEEARQGKKTCTPFANRTYVRANGNIQFCERIESYGILDAKNLRIEQLSSTLHSEFKAMKEGDCSKCFAYNFCEMCPASFIKNGKLDYDFSRIKCDQFRTTFKNALDFYIEQCEQGGDQNAKEL